MNALYWNARAFNANGLLAYSYAAVAYVCIAAALVALVADFGNSGGVTVYGGLCRFHRRYQIKQKTKKKNNVTLKHYPIGAQLKIDSLNFNEFDFFVLSP